MGPYAGADHNLASCPLRSRHRRQPYARVDLNPYTRVDFIPQLGTLDLASDIAGKELPEAKS